MTLSASMIYVVLLSLERWIPACLFEGGVGHDNAFDPSVNQQSVCLFKHTSFVSDSHGGQMDWSSVQLLIGPSKKLDWWWKWMQW